METAGALFRQESYRPEVLTAPLAVNFEKENPETTRAVTPNVLIQRHVGASPDFPASSQDLIRVTKASRESNRIVTCPT